MRDAGKRAAAAGARYGGWQGRVSGAGREPFVGNGGAAGFGLADQTGQVGKNQDQGGGKNDHACLAHFYGIEHGEWPCCFLRRGRRAPAYCAEAMPRLVLIIQAVPAKPGDDADSGQSTGQLPMT